ncbi:MAG: FAD:protein FMN transferase [Gemmatimonadales bacterium]
MTTRPNLTARGTVLLTTGILVLGVVTAVRVLTPRTPVVHEFTGPTMGTSYTIKMWGPGLPPAAVAALIDSAVGRLEQVDRLMSTYDSTSELSRFNRRQDTVPVALSPEVIEVLAAAREVSSRTDGAFDVTVGPLVEAWGFGSDPRPATLPADSVLERLSQSVGYDLLLVDAGAGTAAKSHPEMVVDLSGIAKGYAVDRVAQVLGVGGAAGFLVEVGGELRAHGSKPDGTPWLVAIERPEPGRRSVHQVIELGEHAIATSGSYRNYYERDGRRYAHLLDPATRRPVSYTGTAVSVVAGTCMEADAWATALSVLGLERGFALAQRDDVAALFVWQTEEGFTSQATDAFSRIVEVVPDGTMN